MKRIKLMRGDCLKRMKEIPDGSVDLILCDLPYGVTSCKWDSIIPFDSLWQQYIRITKVFGSVILTGSQPFTTTIVRSNIELFKYCLVWEKSRGSNFVHANYQPLKTHEDIVIFSKGGISSRQQKSNDL